MHSGSDKVIRVDIELAADNLAALENISNKCRVFSK